MFILSHVSDEVLLDFASGALGEPWSIAVASHLTFCSHCSESFRKIEAIGGVLLSAITPSAGVGINDGFNMVMKKFMIISMIVLKIIIQHQNF